MEKVNSFLQQLMDKVRKMFGGGGSGNKKV